MDRPLHILSLSTPTEESLYQLIEKYKDHLKNTTNSFQDIAHTTNNTRSASFDHRAVIIATDTHSALKVIQEKIYLIGKVEPQNEHQNKPKLCMLFPGQGSQYPGMANQLYSTSPLFKFHFDQCCKILDEECNSQLDLREILWNSTGSGDPTQLNTSINSQIAIFCVNFCLFKLWTSWGVKPDYVLGHSLGESAAVVAVGVRDLRSGLKALLLRTKRIDKLGSGKMIAVKADKVTVEKMIKTFCSGKPNSNYWLDIAALNSPEQTVLTGECDTVQDFYKFCRASGMISVIIASTHAFHSRMLEPAMEHIRKGLITIKSESSGNKGNGSSEIKYISSSEARIVEHEELSDENYWVANTRNTVRFAEACQVAFQEGCQIFIEVGPQSVLSTLVKVNFCGGKNVGELTCLPSLNINGNDWETLLNSLGSYWLTTRGSEIDWKGFDKPYQINRTKVLLPFNPFVSKLDVSAFMEAEYPLIGKCIEVTGNLVIFEKELDVNFYNFEQGTFLAICIAAVVAVNQNEGSNAKLGIIKDFKITQNVNVLNAGLKVRMLTKVSAITGHVKVFLAIKKGDIVMDIEWIEHCYATFENNLNNGANPGYNYLNLKLRKDKWEKRAIENHMEYFTGLYFQNIWSDLCETGNNSLLVSFVVKLSELPGKLCENFLFIHPIIISAMIHLTSLLSRKNIAAFDIGSNAILNTHVQTFCILDKFEIPKNDDESLKLYLFVKFDDNEQPAKYTVWLINSKGIALALMEVV